MHLEEARPIVAYPFQVRGPRRAGGGKRHPESKETRSVLLSALAAAGARWMNVRAQDGKPLAVAFIPEAQFTEHDQTFLEEI